MASSSSSFNWDTFFFKEVCLFQILHGVLNDALRCACADEERCGGGRASEPNKTFGTIHTLLLFACVRACRSKFGDGGGDVLQGGPSLRGGEILDGLQCLVAMVTARVHSRAHAFLRLHRRQKLQGDEKHVKLVTSAARPSSCERHNVRRKKKRARGKGRVV